MRTDSVAELDGLWNRYKHGGDTTARDQLILNYSPLVKYVAGRLSANLPDSVEIADLVSYGIFGLIDAIEKFDLGRGLKFETYAISRIRGAIIDELRSLDWVPRSVRSRAKEVEQAYFVLENSLRRSPSDEEVAAHLGISVQEYGEVLSKLSYTSVASFEELLLGDEHDDGSGGVGAIKDDRAETPDALYEHKEIREILARAIEGLPERELTVILLYYYEELTLKEIGEVLGVTESRVSQMHTKAVLRLRAKVRAAA